MSDMSSVPVEITTKSRIRKGECVVQTRKVIYFFYLASSRTHVRVRLLSLSLSLLSPALAQTNMIPPLVTFHHCHFLVTASWLINKWIQEGQGGLKFPTPSQGEREQKLIDVLTGREDKDNHVGRGIEINLAPDPDQGIPGEVCIKGKVLSVTKRRHGGMEVEVLLDGGDGEVKHFQYQGGGEMKLRETKMGDTQDSDKTVTKYTWLTSIEATTVRIYNTHNYPHL